jgi:hypothetical protein
MLEMTDFFQTDFFQKEAQECRRRAAGAIQKNDREFWLQLAQRWEWLLRRNDGPKVESVRPPPARKSVLQKRFAKRRAA